MDYKQVATDVLQHIGGKENIAHLGHCSTRLRFSLVDNKKVDIKALESTPGVIAVRMTAQCQVVIGNDVVEVYNELQKLVGDVGGEEAADQPKEKKKIGATILDFIVGVFQPLVPAIAGGGILKSLLLLLALLGVLDNEGQTYQILNMVGDAPLYFLPLLVAVTTANKLKVNPLVALSAVGALILPNMTTMLTEGAQLFSFNLQNIAYAYQVFPAILTVLFYAQMEKLFTRFSPKPIRIFFVPMMSLVITVPIALLLLGPAGFTFGQGFAAVILWVYEYVGWLAVALLACVLPFMVAMGMHKALLPYALTTLSGTGREALYMPASLAHNIAESGACFAIALRTKDKRLRTTAVSAGISAFFGITEPALYGVTLQNKKVLASVMIGAFVGGTFVGIVGLQAFVIVGPGLASMSMFLSEDLPRNMLYAAVGFVLSFVVAFLAAFILGKDKEQVQPEEEKFAEKIGKGETFTSPVAGKMIPLSKVQDEVFSSKAMGDGIAVVPSKGELYAPVDGEISMIFETSHALGMKTETGAEILFHVGLNTVQLGGEHFTPQVKVGDQVKAGDVLLTFDLEKIKAAGFDPVTLAIITNTDKYDVQINKQENVTRQDKLMVITQLGG
ncbi:PTS system beta-glucoside-specific IIA component, Glc family /PTS system beta-glucoside-specific IIB component, Glc family /PTS system beta-glucoside-specific IIC component, Glc family [Terribacillus saccharophilus]|uniref:PTS beta-glucoside transporter subunit IIABC n=1 Tax=Terribacillus saccharophilus TaxID=361277 RepID=A0A075LN90_9BACI|nr:MULTISPECIES: beta-glucoside-specific PTS transporter subunit IIABC [Terribacillus]AIF67467.1 PTS beta-glucoside transporter subunit IIABC [Terribacillus goriensis]SEN52541.1 PTS system beta-glucoside-specific IIA component, Glc family /PTS system beta-glucoside-specific IIB component, Glc family /PTS system beta-glucoside-specific IIC component, Glc family [Terribacillus saccharophilus]